MLPLLFGLCALTITAQKPAPPKTQNPKPKIERRTPNIRLRGNDVIATVEGQPISRAELTYFWLQTDPRINALLGDLVASRWKTDRGKSGSYVVTEAEIYNQLYGGGSTACAPILSGLITNRLVDILATRKGILVTKTQAQARAHELFEQVRQQNNLKLTDEEIIKTYNVPRDIFLKDMIFRVQAESLLAADIAERNGHSIRVEDWAEVRALFAAVQPDGDASETEQRFVEAKQRIENWTKEIGGGKTFAEVARTYSENTTRGAGGLLGPTLRGTGTPALEAAIYRLKPGERTVPLRAPNGWYVFQMERRGAQISEEERKRNWQNVVTSKLPLFLSQLRKKAKVTSRIPLPADTPPSNPVAPNQTPDTPPPPPTTKSL
jgi:parvulin-like peptidyl-prolyl isomerase